MRVLLDVDGVLADWLRFYVEQVNRICGTNFKQEDAKSWDVEEAFDISGQKRKQVHQIISRPGSCYGLQAIPGALEGVNWLRDIPEVRIAYVTAPWNSSTTWAYERREWLKDKGFLQPEDSLVFTRDKYLVAGSVFIDDKPANVEAWQKANPNGSGLVWSQPYNYVSDLPRLRNWEELVQHIQWLKGNAR